MKGSLFLGTWAGVRVYMHLTFLLLLAFFAFGEYFRSSDLGQALGSLLFILALFSCVLLHEFGHALAARRYGIQTRDITLLPIGGVARLERMPDDPREELVVAVAGPAVNLVIALVLFAILAMFNGLMPALQALYPLREFTGQFVLDLAKINLFLILFNMIPAFPMDGGRVVRALLATRMPYAKATGAAASLGQGIALIFALDGLGILNILSTGVNPILILIAVFVWFGAAQESGVAQLKATLGGIPVSSAMLTDFRTLSPADPLSRVVELILAGSQQDFPVARDGGEVVGVLTRRDLMQALANGGQAQLVSEVMRRDVGACNATDNLELVFPRLQSGDSPLLPVMNRGRLVGLLTSENIGEFVMIQSAIGQRRRS